MKAKFRKAYNELKKLGAPVRVGEDFGFGQYNCEFVLVDGWDDTANLFLNYFPASYSEWENGTYSDEVAAIFNKYDLYGEWANCEVLCVHEI